MKRINLMESQMNRLFEYHTQLNIPFKGDTPNYDFKENWENYRDFLEEIGQYGKLPSSGYDEREIKHYCMEWGLEEAFDFFLSFEDDNDGEAETAVLSEFLHNFSSFDDLKGIMFDEYIELLKEVTKNGVFDVFEDENPREIDEFLYKVRLRNNVDNIALSILTEQGQNMYLDVAKEYYMESFGYYGFPDNLIVNNRGLIYCEREINIPNAFDRTDNTDNYNYYKILKLNYSGLGNCWSWKQGGGFAYNLEPFGIDDTLLLLKGWVDPKSVNWTNTVYRNGYTMKEEREIYINTGGIVEVDSALCKVKDGKTDNFVQRNILTKPILVKA